jgi:DNA invertase Pin-like site-specific DNA recombinase
VQLRWRSAWSPDKLEGIAQGRAKAAGVYKGRPASIDAAKVREMKAQGLVAKFLKIGRALVYRLLDERPGA